MLSIVDEPNDVMAGIAREAASLMLETEKPAVFEGTRWECEAFLDSFFNIQRKITEGARSKATGDEAAWFDEILDTLDKRVYRVTVSGIGVVTDDAVRPENAYRAMRMQTALDMFDALKDAAENTENVGE
jgi:hypothetical protein